MDVMISIRAIALCTLALVLLGCSHTLHYNYPPPHPPGEVLDLSSVQEPKTLPEQPAVEATPSQKQENPREPQQDVSRTEQTAPDDAVPRASVQQDPPGTRGPDGIPLSELRPRVKYWVERLSGREKRTFQSQLARLDKIRPAIEEILVRHELPADLSYLCLVESGANPHAVSCSGATGYWQFIPDTARRYGLQINKYVDERKNLEKSTYAAAQYLKNLYAIFGDWYLAIAAYNAGEGTVTRLMKSHGIDSFWDIDRSMPIKTETIEYVPKYMATLIIAKNREAFGLPSSGNPPSGVPRTIDAGGYLDDIVRADDSAPSIRYTIRKGDTLYSLARRHSTTVQAIARANRMSERDGLRTGKTIVIPAGKGGKAKGLDQQEEVHRVVKGETVRSISRKYGVSVAEIVQANNIKNPRTIQPSTVLVIPRSQGGASKVSATKYTVKKGDTLWAISRQHDVSSAELMKWNKITSTAQIKPGDELTIYQR